jgi:hypothetical protein
MQVNLFFINQFRKGEFFYNMNLDEILFIYQNWETKNELEKRNLNSCCFEDFLDYDEREEIDKTAHFINKNWYKLDGADFTIYEGISLGQVIEYSLLLPLVTNIKFLAAVRNIVNLYKPKTIYHNYSEFDDEYKIINEVANKFGIEVKSVRFSYIDKNNYSLTNVSNLFKKMLKKIIIRSLSCIFQKITFTKGTKNVLFYQDRQIDAILEKWLCKKNNQIQVVLDLDKTPPLAISVKLLAKGVKVINSEVKSKDLKEVNLNNINKIIRKWMEIKKDEGYKKQFQYKGICTFGIIEKYLDDFVFKRFIKIACKMEKLRKLLCSNHIKGVVFPNDCTEDYRLMALLCKELKIPTFLVQHGIYDWKRDPDRKLSDYLIVWSEFFKDYCLREGVVAKKIFVTGCPVYDVYYNNLEKFKSKKLKNIKRKIIILTTNAATRSSFENILAPKYFITEIMDILRKMNLSVDIVVKIHPAESIRDYKLTLADSLKNVKILKKGSLRKIINGADIVISAASGALFDACILGKKVICFLAAREEIVKKSDTIFKKIKEVKTVFNKDELRQALLIFLNEKELLMELDEANRNSFKEYIGVIDGGASVRALDAIESVMYEQ